MGSQSGCLLHLAFAWTSRARAQSELALIWFGLLFAVAISGGRTSFGLSDAGTSRYVTFDLLILVGSSLVIIDRSTQMAANPIRSSLAAGNSGCCRRSDLLPSHFGYQQWDFRCPRYRDYEVTGAIVTANIRRAPDGLVISQLGAGYEPADFIRRMAERCTRRIIFPFLNRRHRLVFQTDLPMKPTPPTTSLINPTAGKTLRGKLFVVAAASDSFGITKVQLIVRGMTDARRSSANGSDPYVYLGGWNTKTVPDGVYSLRSIAYSPGGLTGFSPWTVVRVAN